MCNRNHKCSEAFTGLKSVYNLMEGFASVLELAEEDANILGTSGDLRNFY